jgi:probable phosphoglycerate mutase
MRHADVSYFDAVGKPVPPDGVPLNAEGRRQAQATAADLAGVPLDRVIASQLPRTQETARLVLGARQLPIEVEPALREIEPGRLRDLPTDNLEGLFLGVFGAGITRDTRFLGGETFGSLADRVLPAFERLLDEPSWRHLLVVAHGGVNRMILTHLLGMSLGGFALLEQDPCCLNIIDVVAGGRFVVRLVNHTCYNPGKRGLELTTMERLYQEYRGRSNKPEA